MQRHIIIGIDRISIFIYEHIDALIFSLFRQRFFKQFIFLFSSRKQYFCSSSNAIDINFRLCFRRKISSQGKVSTAVYVGVDHGQNRWPFFELPGVKSVGLITVDGLHNAASHQSLQWFFAPTEHIGNNQSVWGVGSNHFCQMQCHFAVDILPDIVAGLI